MSLVEHEVGASTFGSQIARTANRSICVPTHPEGYFSVELENFTLNLIKQSQINKILYVQSSRLAPIILENQWLCNLDLALIGPPLDTDMMQRLAFILVDSTNNIKLLMLHDLNDNQDNEIHRLYDYFDKIQLPKSSIIDMAYNTEEKHLLAMFPKELYAWFCSDDTKIRYDIRSRIETKLLKDIWSALSQQLDVSQLLIQIKHEIGFVPIMQEESLDLQVKAWLLSHENKNSYSQILSSVVDEFFESFTELYKPQAQVIIQQHLKNKRFE